ncbi:hypothetical protein LTR53_013086 [Teratosphaeriaceae sp. CCFEE 6253]|nr:hypothetical protein LTR53_013086 [Teratosphaeriaceae sp. CCFEE 6253]
MAQSLLWCVVALLALVDEIGATAVGASSSAPNGTYQYPSVSTVSTSTGSSTTSELHTSRSGSFSSLDETSMSDRPLSASHSNATYTPHPLTSAAANVTTSSELYTSLSETLSKDAASSSSPSSSGLGAYIRSGIGYGASENVSISTSSSTSVPTTSSITTLYVSGTSASSSANPGGTEYPSGIGSYNGSSSTAPTPFPPSASGYITNSSTRNVTVFYSTVSTLYSLSTGATGYSSYSHGSGSIGVNASDSYSYNAGNTTSAVAGTATGTYGAYPNGASNETISASGTGGRSSTAPTAFSMPSQGFQNSGNGNSTGIFATGSGTIGTGPVTSSVSSPWTMPAAGNGGSLEMLESGRTEVWVLTLQYRLELRLGL